MPIRTVPGTASIAQSDQINQGKMFAPAAERNADVIGDLLEQVVPAQGHALELASGTGQHITRFATRFPRLEWHPSEVDASRRASISAYVEEAALPNLAAPIALDATAPGWATRHSGYDLILLVNLLHLISVSEAETLISETARALAPNGRFVIYGPFKRGDELTSDGDRAFHASLVAHDPEIGYKDDFDTMDLMQTAGLEMVEVLEMPANNLALVAGKPGF
ncbi:MAG: DUF938 domain-containing protein [Rhodobacteraceae bacterium]|nr:DUF938 domain-containing protein [Paracoccaceae bacterium]